MKTTFRLSALTLASLLALNACQDKPAEQAAAPQAASAAAQAPAQQYDNSSASAEDKDLLTKAQGIFRPLPARAEIDAAQPLTEGQIQLGQQLWYEPRLSRGNTVSCNSCHNLASHGVDNMPTSQGYKGLFGGRNSPTALNAALLGSQFWDGRAADVEEQAGGPLLNPVEYGDAQPRSCGGQNCPHSRISKNV